MTRTQIPDDQIGAFASGMLDVLFAFAIVLERRGLLARSEIAAALAVVQKQAEEQEGKRTARTLVAELMRKAFDLPFAGEQARARLTVIDGGAAEG